MNKTRHLTKTFFMVTITAIFCIPVLSQSTDSLQETISLPVGRENPFAQLPRYSSPQDNPILIEQVEPPPELFTHAVTLKFLDAISLKLAMDNMSSRYGVIVANAENNSLIICDTKENLDRIISEIQKIDKTPKQIMVEVVIIDVQLNDETEIGINWDILSDNTYNIGYRQNFTSRLGSTIEDATNVGNATAFNTTGTGGDFSVISGTIRNVIHLLQQKRELEILASPRVLVVSGKTASIEAVQELPYNEITSTSEGGQLSSTEFKKVGVKLNVTATITEDNLILLSVDSEQNVTIGESVAQVPIIDTRNTKSELLLTDGQVVIMGGLRRKETTREINQIPILGDIPLIGLLFKYTDITINNTELIMFISPHIYKGDEPIPEAVMEKYKEIKERPTLSIQSKDDTTENNHDRTEYTSKEHIAIMEQHQRQTVEQKEKAVQKEHRSHIDEYIRYQSYPDNRLNDDFTNYKHSEDKLSKY